MGTSVSRRCNDDRKFPPVPFHKTLIHFQQPYERSALIRIPEDYAYVSLKVAMHINSSLNELRSIESQDLAKPVSRAKRRRYEDLQKVLAAYDSSDWGDVLVAGVPKSEAISKVFSA
jgi:hypothetical protein